MKKIGFLFLTILMMMLFAMSVSALEPTGQCGKNVYWTFDKNTGVLVISGSGTMYSYDVSGVFGEPSPFYSESVIKKIIIEEGVKNIGSEAFRHCYFLKSVIIADSVETIRERAFYECSALKDVTIIGSVQSIFDKAFGLCSGIENFEFAEGTEYIGAYAFHMTKIKYVVIPNSMKEIDDSAFIIADLEQFTLPSVPLKLGNNFVNYSVSSSGSEFYMDKHLVKYQIPSSSYSVKEGTLSIAEGAVNNGTLQKVYIPASVGIISSRAFNTPKLTDVYYAGSQEEWEEIVMWTNFDLDDARKHFNHKHNYEKTVITEPTHLLAGETIYTCICGDTYTDSLKPIDHEYKIEITKQPTHLQMGEKTYTCDCGYSYSETVAKLEGHTYSINVDKEATHTQEGKITYTCLCSDTYSEVIPKLIEHTYSFEVTKQATHTEEGKVTYSCLCGDLYTESIEKLTGHTYTTNIVLPACDKDGYTTFICECGDSYNDNYVKARGHYDDNKDGNCDSCGETISCEDCGRPLHYGEIDEYICVVVMIVKLVISFLKSVK